MTKRRWIAVLVSGVLSMALALPAAAQTVDNVKPVASFQASRTSETDPNTVLLDATGSSDSDGSIARYQWAFGDGTTGSGPQVEHTYPDIDAYEIALVVIDDRGASHMTTRTIDLDDLASTEQPGSAPATTASTPTRPLVVSSAPVGTEIGDRAPDFTLPTFDGEAIALSDFLGQVVIVDFWFGSCSGCLSSLPHLEELRAAFASQGLAVMILVLDRDPDPAEEYFAASPYGGFVLLHEHDASRPTRSAYGVRGTPHAFLIDRTGVIRFSGKPAVLTRDHITRWL